MLLGICQNFDFFNRTQLFFVVHYSLIIKNLKLRSRWQHNRLVKAFRKSILFQTFLLLLLFFFFSQFVAFVDQHTNILTLAYNTRIVIMNFADVKMQTHVSNDRLLAEQLLSHKITLHDLLSR